MLRRAFISSFFLLLTTNTIVDNVLGSNGDCNNAGSGYECGYHNGYPIFTILGFNLEDCDTDLGSWHYSYNNGLTNIERFTTVNRDCKSDNFGYGPDVSRNRNEESEDPKKGRNGQEGVQILPVMTWNQGQFLTMKSSCKCRIGII